MSSTENLLKATLNRLAARLGNGALDTAAEIAVMAKDAPEKFRKEWDLFQAEVFAELNRLNEESSAKQEEVYSYGEINSTKQTSKKNTPQEKIDYLRSKVADLTKRIEDKN